MVLNKLFIVEFRLCVGEKIRRRRTGLVTMNDVVLVRRWIDAEGQHWMTHEETLNY